MTTRNTSATTRLPTEAELDILHVLWDHGPSTVRQVQQHLATARPTVYTTVLKQLQMMAEKGLVRRNARLRSHVYEARFAREETQRRIAADLLDRAFRGSPAALLLGVLSARSATPSDLAEIRKMIDDYEKRQR
ncbi:MAG: BlaI/MecI/CopY family transcriptional regulator [Vicinamibacterales bacterium]